MKDTFGLTYSDLKEVKPFFTFHLMVVKSVNEALDQYSDYILTSDNGYQVENAVRQMTAHLQAQRLYPQNRKTEQTAEPQVAVLEASLPAAEQISDGLKAVLDAARLARDQSVANRGKEPATMNNQAPPALTAAMHPWEAFAQAFLGHRSSLPEFFGRDFEDPSAYLERCTTYLVAYGIPGAHKATSIERKERPGSGGAATVQYTSHGKAFRSCCVIDSTTRLLRTPSLHSFTALSKEIRKRRAHFCSKNTCCISVFSQETMNNGGIDADKSSTAVTKGNPMVVYSERLINYPHQSIEAREICRGRVSTGRASEQVKEAELGGKTQGRFRQSKSK